MADLLRDFQYAFRTMRARPGFTAIAAATIAVGICATTVVFSLVATLLLNPLPVPEPDGLVTVDEIHQGGTERIMGATAFSFPRYAAYREASREVLTDLAGHRIAEGSLRIGDTADVANMVLATANYFDVLGLRPAHGRFFAPDANRSGRLTAVIGYGAWTTRFGADPEAIGRTVYVNSRPHEVIGVAAAHRRRAHCELRPRAPRDARRPDDRAPGRVGRGFTPRQIRPTRSPGHKAPAYHPGKRPSRHARCPSTRTPCRVRPG